MTKTKLEGISPGYLSDIREYVTENKHRVGLTEGQDVDEFIASHCAETLFGWWLEWNGIIGYQSTLWTLVAELKEASK